MYNHYIPQSDGSYRRNPQTEHRKSPQPHPKPEQPRESPPEPAKPAPPPCPPQQNQVSLLDFFKGLLPRGLDTADLMIVFLLLLMNKDDEGGISPVLTLALYFLL